MPIGLADLLVAVGGGSPAGLFGRGEATGDNRAHEALERALKSPLLDRGRLISECHAVVANLVGPVSLSFSEVAAVMREVRRHTADDAKLFLGVTTVSDPAAPLIVTLFGNYSKVPMAEAAMTPAQSAISTAIPVAPIAPPPQGEPVAVAEASAETPETVETDSANEADPAAQKAAKAKAKQETLQFESTTRGRFDKSEPTIVEGEDLDVPTFLRERKPN